jgi:hypothetical protein
MKRSPDVLRNAVVAECHNAARVVALLERARRENETNVRQTQTTASRQTLQTAIVGQ